MSNVVMYMFCSIQYICVMHRYMHVQYIHYSDTQKLMAICFYSIVLDQVVPSPPYGGQTYSPSSYSSTSPISPPNSYRPSSPALSTRKFGLALHACDARVCTAHYWYSNTPPDNLVYKSLVSFPLITVPLHDINFWLW